jgi:hypothetical protein
MSTTLSPMDVIFAAQAARNNAMSLAVQRMFSRIWKTLTAR